MIEENQPPLVRIDGLFLRVEGLPLLEGVDLLVQRGGRIGITGPSGCGKSTLLKSIIAKRVPQGSLFERFDINFGNGSGRCGYIPQSNGLLPWYSLGRNVATYSVIGSDLGATKERLLRALDLSDRCDHFPDQLSGGEIQRGLLACGMACEPDIFIADEPLTEVDLERKFRMLAFWSAYMEERKAALIVVSHDIDVLVYLCDEIILLSGSPAKVSARFTLGSAHPREQFEVAGTESAEVRRSLAEALIRRPIAASLKDFM